MILNDSKSPLWQTDLCEVYVVTLNTNETLVTRVYSLQKSLLYSSTSLGLQIESRSEID